MGMQLSFDGYHIDLTPPIAPSITLYIFVRYTYDARLISK